VRPLATTNQPFIFLPFPGATEAHMEQTAVGSLAGGCSTTVYHWWFNGHLPFGKQA